MKHNDIYTHVKQFTRSTLYDLSMINLAQINLVFHAKDNRDNENIHAERQDQPISVVWVISNRFDLS